MTIDYYSDAQLDAIAALDVHLDDDARIAAADGMSAREAAERSSLPDWLREDDRHGPGPAPLRTLLICDYIEARERSEANGGEAEERLLRLGEQFGASRALARFLVDAGEYPTARAATDAIEAGRVSGMRHTKYGPDGFTPINVEVPF